MASADASSPNPPRLNAVHTIVLDIEGTVCPIAFVRETLFPYALKSASSVVLSQWDEPTFQPYRSAFPKSTTTSPEALNAHIRDLTERDVKDPALKALQGYLWKTGYVNGDLHAPLFPDVIPALQQWHDLGKRIVIYSSGSVEAQQLLFSHIEDPEAVNGSRDISHLIRGWFDTVNAGSKVESASYAKILQQLSGNATSEEHNDKYLFLSDNVHEIHAAREAGLLALLVDRPGNGQVDAQDWQLEKEHARALVGIPDGVVTSLGLVRLV